MDKKEKVAVALAVAGLAGLDLYLYLRSKKVSAVSTPTTTSTRITATPTSTPISTFTPTIPILTPSYGQVIGPITFSTALKLDASQVLVVAVGGGGAGGGTGGTIEYEQAGSGGPSIVINDSNQMIFAGGGAGGWNSAFNDVNWSWNWGGGTGSVENVQYYQILNGYGGGYYGQAGVLSDKYTQAIQQVLEEAGVIVPLALKIPTPPPTQTGPCFSPTTCYSWTTLCTGFGFGAGGCGNGNTLNTLGSGGGSGAIVVGIMNGGTFNITVGQGGQLSPHATYSCPSCSVGLPGAVYLVPLP
ncbi:MAG: hypothetical protein QXP36_13045 [Conexivisphaerales archaeon]